MSRRTSSSCATITRSSFCRNLSTMARGCRLPIASSPIMKGCVATCSRTSRSVSMSSSRRDGGSTPRCPPVSRNLRSATAHRLQMRLRTAHPGQPACGFTLDQGLKRRTHQSGLFTDPRELPRVGNQIIVEYDCRPHRLPRRRTASFKASLDVNYNAWRSAIALCRAVFVSGCLCVGLALYCILQSQPLWRTTPMTTVNANIAAPRMLQVGGGAVRQIAELLGKFGLSRPLVVTDPFMVSSRHVQHCLEPLVAAGIAVAVFSDTVPDPTDTVVEVGVAEMQRGNFDCLIGFGGGSPIDTAKAMAILAAGGGKMRDYKVPFAADRGALPVIAIPTTAGTGTECTRFTVITDTERDEKMLIAGLG